MPKLHIRQQSDKRTPHLSVVAVSRNDDHGHDLRGRMQHFVNGFIAQCQKHHLNAELILVEWNPPTDRPSLEHALEWPEDFGPATVRIVTVPPDVHSRLPNADALPLFQMIGKNVGIRRARGRFVLATNIDILLDDQTVIYLRDQLTPGVVLRADRYDVPADLSKDVQFDQIITECGRRFFQVNRRFGVFDVQRRRFRGMGNGFDAQLLGLYNEIRIIGLADPLRRMLRRLLGYLSVAGAMFGRLVADGRVSLRGVLEQLTKMFAGAIQLSFWAMLKIPTVLYRNIPKIRPVRTMPNRAYWCCRRVLRRIDVRITPRLPRPLRGMLRAARWLLRTISSIPRRLISVQRVSAKAWRLMGSRGLFQLRSPSEHRLARSQRLHTNACGDFTLLACDDWYRLRGYPEWPIFSWHIDSVFMFAADANDIRHVALGPKYRIFHIDHSAGSGWSPDGAARLFARLDRSGIPYFSDDDVMNIRKSFAENPSTAIVNDVNWGLFDVSLPEREVTQVNARNLNADQKIFDKKFDSGHESLGRVDAN